jgi:hypothetical protein
MKGFRFCPGFGWFSARYMGGGGGSAPPVPPVPPAAAPPTMANPAVAMSAASQRANATAAERAGLAGTLTNTGGAQGLIPGTPGQGAVTGRSLLG